MEKSALTAQVSWITMLLLICVFWVVSRLPSPAALYSKEIFDDRAAVTIKLWSVHTLVVALLVLLPVLFRRNKTYYPVTKPLPVAYLIFYVLSKSLQGCQYCANKQTTNFIFGGLVLGIFGDILLTVKGKLALAVGGLSFLFGHLMYLVGYLAVPWALPVYYSSVILALLSLPVVVMFYLFNTRPGITSFERIVGPLYFCMMALMILAAVNFDYEVIRKPDPPFATLGAVLFFLSDSILLPALIMRRQHIKTPPWKHLVILTTYYFAQQFITWSVVTPV